MYIIDGPFPPAEVAWEYIYNMLPDRWRDKIVFTTHCSGLYKADMHNREHSEQDVEGL